MQTLIIEINSSDKAKELSSLDFVCKVSSGRKKKELIAALQDDEDLKASIVKGKTNP